MVVVLVSSVMEPGLLPSSLTVRVVYEDLPDLIEIEARVTAGCWGGAIYAYTPPHELSEDAKKLARWAENPQGEMVVEAGEDRAGIGWLRLRFYCVDLAGHVVCHVQMASMGGKRPEEMWRLALELKTEPGLIIQFAQHLESVALSGQGEAALSVSN